MAKPPASLPSFSHFATGFSPFLQLALCPFPEFSRKSEEQKEETLPQEAGIGSLFFSSSLLQNVDTGIRDSEPAIPKRVVRSVPIADL